MREAVQVRKRLGGCPSELLENLLDAGAGTLLVLSLLGAHRRGHGWECLLNGDGWRDRRVFRGLADKDDDRLWRCGAIFRGRCVRGDENAIGFFEAFLEGLQEEGTQGIRGTPLLPIGPVGDWRLRDSNQWWSWCAFMSHTPSIAPPVKRGRQLPKGENKRAQKGTRRP